MFCFFPQRPEQGATVEKAPTARWQTLQEADPVTALTLKTTLHKKRKRGGKRELKHRQTDRRTDEYTDTPF